MPDLSAPRREDRGIRQEAKSRREPTAGHRSIRPSLPPETAILTAVSGKAHMAATTWSVLKRYLRCPHHCFMPASVPGATQAIVVANAPSGERLVHAEWGFTLATRRGRELRPGLHEAGAGWILGMRHAPDTGAGIATGTAVVLRHADAWDKVHGRQAL